MQGDKPTQRNQSCQRTRDIRLFDDHEDNEDNYHLYLPPNRLLPNSAEPARCHQAWFPHPRAALLQASLDPPPHSDAAQYTYSPRGITTWKAATFLTLNLYIYKSVQTIPDEFGTELDEAIALAGNLAPQWLRRIPLTIGALGSRPGIRSTSLLRRHNGAAAAPPGCRPALATATQLSMASEVTRGRELTFSLCSCMLLIPFMGS